jgi:hypothetical protein
VGFGGIIIVWIEIDTYVMEKFALWGRMRRMGWGKVV